MRSARCLCRKDCRIVRWFRHAIYAPGEYTGYAAVVIPGVNEALDKGDSDRARQQLAVLAAALERAAKTLEGYR